MAGCAGALFAASFAAAAGAAGPSDSPVVLGSFGDWTAFAEGTGAAKTCYAAAAPIKQEGKYTERGKVAALVTHSLADKSFDVVSIVAGYDYKKDEDVLAQVDAKKFTLFSQADRAWNRDGAGDKAMVEAMKKGSRLTVIGVSARGTRTTDVYSLSGFGKAYEAIGKACPRKPGKTQG